ncbi:MAG: DUF6036 family nucleotidyltransferase [Planctomycetota bacterium]
MNFPPDFREFLQLLDAHGVEYVITGGYAVAYHGVPRFTGDLDVYVRPSPDNAARLVRVIDEFGFGSADLTPADFTAEGQTVQLGIPPLRIDLVMKLDGVSADDVFARKIRDEDRGVSVWFISREDLVRNKKTMNRPRDVADLENFPGDSA